VERDQEEAAHVELMLVQCQNCGETAGPSFCGHCGQAVDAHRSPLRTLLREFAEEMLAVDGRFIRTLRALPRPGLLTTLFLAGKRASFVSPVRLYLLASVALFSTALSLGTPAVDSINLFIGQQLMNPPLDTRRTNVTIVPGDSAVGRYLTGRHADNLSRLRALPPQDMLERVFSGLRRVLPVALIVFVPFLAAALKILYFRRHTLYVDHLVFSAHFQAAFFAALVLVWLVQATARPAFFVMVILYMIVAALMLLWYLPAALRRVYNQRASVTWAKALVLAMVYLQLLANVLGLAVFLVLQAV
jgi:hypothetical protein